MTTSYEDRAKCGAKTNKGTVCQAFAMSNGKCRVHGGASKGAPKGNDHAKRHGIYSEFFTEEEKTWLDDNKPGDFTPEINMYKTRIKRIIAKLDEIDEDPNNEFHEAGLEVSEITETDSEQEGHTKEVKRRRTNYLEMLDKFSARLISLEKAQKEIRGEQTAKDEATQQAQKVLDALAAMKKNRNG